MKKPAVAIKSLMKPVAMRWQHYAEVTYRGKRYEVNFLTDDEGLEEDNLVIYPVLKSGKTARKPLDLMAPAAEAIVDALNDLTFDPDNGTLVPTTPATQEGA